VGVSRDLGRTKRPINPANGGIAIIPRHCDVLICTPHSSEILAPCSRSALPTYRKASKEAGRTFLSNL
jgi:hypothetical protein